MAHKVSLEVLSLNFLYFWKNSLKTTKFSVPSFHIRTREQYEQHVNHPEGSFIGFFPSLQGTDMCGEEKAEAEKSPLYDYKRAYFKIVQALIDDHRIAIKL